MNPCPMKPSVVITGMGLICPLGERPQAIIGAMQEDRVGFTASGEFSDVVVYPVTGFDLGRRMGRFKNKRYLHRGAQFALAAAAEAIKQAGLTPAQLESAGLFLGAGPCLDVEETFPRIDAGRAHWRNVPALWMLKFLPNTPASVIAQRFQIHGDNHTVVTACAAGLQAVGEAFRKVRDGYLTVALAGAGDSRLSRSALMAYYKAQALALNTDNPQGACRPFDMDRRGFVPGEGGAFFVLESRDHALGRRAPILAEICGYGASIDGHAMTAPDPSGQWAEHAVRRALSDAGVIPDQVDVVSAHGTGTPLNDAMEADLIQRVFAGHHPRVIALKSWVGHLSAACGAVELALCLALAQKAFWPPVRNLNTPCRDDVAFVRRPEHGSAGTVLLENFGFGGQNAALVIRPWTG
jgi:3-oxoacyl-[acyl-carrier-protein] synthase II